MKRNHSLPEFYTQAIDSQLQDLGYRLDESKRLAEAVRQLSDHYLQNPEAPTPWHESWAQAASLAYYFPLNFARNSAVAMEAQRLGFFEGIKGLVDFGSGTGSALFAFLQYWTREKNQDPPHVLAADVSARALELAFRLRSNDTSDAYERETLRAPGRPRGLQQFALDQALLTASYVLTELSELPEWWFDFEAIAIIEPSTQEDGRALMSARDRLIQQGYQIWAPCCHQGSCPLLTHSARDWCHDRIHWQAPRWFTEIEKHLPMKNRTLTHSYLLARRRASPPGRLQKLARLTGDMLEEKGKTRQLICRGSEREFLAWFPGRLAKGEEIDLQRGSLVELKGPTSTKASELRISSKDSIFEFAPTESLLDL